MKIVSSVDNLCSFTNFGRVKSFRGVVDFLKTNFRKLEYFLPCEKTYQGYCWSKIIGFLVVKMEILQFSIKARLVYSLRLRAGPFTVPKINWLNFCLLTKVRPSASLQTGGGGADKPAGAGTTNRRGRGRRTGGGGADEPAGPFKVPKINGLNFAWRRVKWGLVIGRAGN